MRAKLKTWKVFPDILYTRKKIQTSFMLMWFREKSDWKLCFCAVLDKKLRKMPKIA
jgi:hypothetical protein